MLISHRLLSSVLVPLTLAGVGCRGPAGDSDPDAAGTAQADASGAEVAAESAATDDQTADPSEWRPLFDGESLDGWIPKIVGYPAGEDPLETFRVENGLLVVNYDAYEGVFAGRFGHLFYELPLTNYRLRIVYRFLGEQLPDGPGWAWRNSGVMLHCEDPMGMGLNQSFPVSIEAQMLGGDGTNERSTGNVCTPGTHVVMGGELVTNHCVNSSSRTYHGDQWVTLELEVRGNEHIVHYVDGEPVIEYERPQLDPNDGDAARLMESGTPQLASGSELEIANGWIAVQAESHPMEVRSIELKLLDGITY